MDIKKGIGEIINKAKPIVENGTNKAKEFVGQGKKIADEKIEDAFKALDQNGDGKIELIDIVILSLKTPGIRVDREEYLKKTLEKKYPKEIVYDAIKYNPKHAGVEYTYIESIADEAIEFERKCASSGSAILGIPGGAAIAATLPLDIIQYSSFLIRVAQKLMYIYGYPELNIKEGNTVDEDTMKILEMCLGVMLGVQGAETALKVAMPIWAKGVEAGLKESGTILKYGVKAILPKAGGFVFSGISKLIPLLGGVIGGGVTYAMFKPSCDKLKKFLRDNPYNAVSNE